MSQQKRNSSSSSSHSSHQHEQANGVGNKKISSSTLARPQGSNPDEWKAYWQAQGQSWRTEPEISQQRQEELTRCRATPVDIENGIYPFGGKKLNRADVEWLLATHENGRGPVVWSDEKQRKREGLDLRGADLCSGGNKRMDLQGLPLTRLRGALTFSQMFRYSEEFRIKARIQLERANLGDAHLEGAALHGAQLEGADLSGAQLEGASLSGAQLKGANLSEAQLKGADLRGAHLERASLEGAQLKGAALDWAQLEGANPQ